jgi:N-acetyl-1-D-myo-inositol-2-amino-2-deoxy-alpha-D-glucopyranoside deacetylase
MAKTLLAVHAHPDDETITMGGTLARYSAAGLRTVVVTCTRGDLGEVRDPSPSLSRVAADTVTGGSSLHRTGDDAVTEGSSLCRTRDAAVSEGPAQHPAAGDAALGERSRRRAAESGAAWHADIGESNNRFEGLESDLFAGLG